MESNRLLNSENDDRALEGLLDAFSNVFSLDDIADAYCKSGKNAALAGAMLYDMQESASSSSNSSDFSIISNGNLSSESSESAHEIVVQCPENEKFRGASSKSKRRQPASMGTVSSVVGKSYWRPKTSVANRTDVTDNKPLKLELELEQKDFPTSEIRGRESGFARDDDGLHFDVEDFLVKMLGNGFNLDRGTIHDVLGSCGYDIEKSMEKLLDLSATTLDKRDSLQCQSSKKSFENLSAVENPSSDDSNRNRVLQTNGFRRPGAQKEKSDIQKEVLTSLFTVPGRYESSSKVTSPVRARKRYGPFGLVVEPLRDVPLERNNQTISAQPEIEEDKEDSYKVIRKAVMEYRVMTKEYFKSAVEAFVNGDRDKADKLLEQGLFFQRKARETDEESAEMIFDSREEEVQETMPLDLHDMGAKDALRLLKHHISSLSGIPSFTFLKVIVEREEDTSKGARKRLILRLLEKESIKWTEEDPGTIVIRLDEINRKTLSFAKK